MTEPLGGFSVRVDVTNPGQFFACCGLLELASRLWPGAEGWFGQDVFCVAAANCRDGLGSLVAWLRGVELHSDDEAADDKTCPLCLRHSADGSSPTGSFPLRLDWWEDEAGVGGSLKTWAGQQRVTAIGRAMHHSATLKDAPDMSWLDWSVMVRDPEGGNEVVEPFYFDARRWAHALDVGFSCDRIGAAAAAYPAVEFMALVGLQRFRPHPVEGDRWAFEYFSWGEPLGVVTAAAAACGAVPVPGRRGFRFCLRFRDDQKRYKGFGFAIQIGGVG